MLPNKFYKIDPCDNLLKKIKPEQPQFEKGKKLLEKLVFIIIIVIIFYIVIKSSTF